MLRTYAIEVPEVVLAHLTSGRGETPKPHDPRFVRNTHYVIRTARHARATGVTPYILSDAIEGEARDIGLMHAALARHVARYGQPFQRPCVLLSGGETTVTMRGTGRGGRNGEFLLSIALALDGEPRIYAIACDTDGIDGSEDNAGALLAPDALVRARKAGLNVRALQENNDNYTFFSALEELIVSGPTHTNVNDFRAILIE